MSAIVAVLAVLVCAQNPKTPDKESKLEGGVTKKEWQKRKDKHKERVVRSQDRIEKDAKSTIESLHEKWEATVKVHIKVQNEAKKHETLELAAAKVDNNVTGFRKQIEDVKADADFAAIFKAKSWEDMFDSLAYTVDAMQDLSDELQKQMADEANEFEEALEEIEELLEALDDLMDEFDGTIGDDDDDYDDWDDEDITD